MEGFPASCVLTVGTMSASGYTDLQYPPGAPPQLQERISEGATLFPGHLEGLAVHMLAAEQGPSQLCDGADPAGRALRRAQATLQTPTGLLLRPELERRAWVVFGRRDRGHRVCSRQTGLSPGTDGTGADGGGESFICLSI